MICRSIWTKLLVGASALGGRGHKDWLLCGRDVHYLPSCLHCPPPAGRARSSIQKITSQNQKNSASLVRILGKNRNKIRVVLLRCLAPVVTHLLPRRCWVTTSLYCSPLEFLQWEPNNSREFLTDSFNAKTDRILVSFWLHVKCKRED